MLALVAAQSFGAKLEVDKDGTWRYVHVPRTVRNSLKGFERRGIIPITATVAGCRWDGSLLPWADGSAQLSIPKPICTKLALRLGQRLRVEVRPRVEANR